MTSEWHWLEVIKSVDEPFVFVMQPVRTARNQEHNEGGGHHITTAPTIVPPDRSQFPDEYNNIVRAMTSHGFASFEDLVKRVTPRSRREKLEDYFTHKSDHIWAVGATPPPPSSSPRLVCVQSATDKHRFMAINYFPDHARKSAPNDPYDQYLRSLNAKYRSCPQALRDAGLRDWAWAIKRKQPVDYEVPASLGNIEELRMLTVGPPIDTRYGTRAMVAAAREGHTEALEILHEKGCLMSSAVIMAAIARRHTSTIEWLLAHNCPLDEPRMATHATRYGRLDVIKKLKASGLQVDMAQVALLAAELDHLIIIEWLMQQCPEPTTLQRVRACANARGHTRICKFIDDQRQ